MVRLWLAEQLYGGLVYLFDNGDIAWRCLSCVDPVNTCGRGWIDARQPDPVAFIELFIQMRHFDPFANTHCAEGYIEFADLPNSIGMLPLGAFNEGVSVSQRAGIAIISAPIDAEDKV
jgi:hypothetical protein